MKLKNKILLIGFLLFMFLILFNTSNVFASFDFKYNDANYSLPDLPEDSTYFIILKNGTYYDFLCSDEPIYFRYSENGDRFDSTSGLIHYKVKSSDSSWTYNTKWPAGGGYTLSERILYYSSHSIYDKDGNLVFQRPVAEIAVIPALETAEEVPKAMVQTLRILIPVGLVVLSILLVIYLAKRVIYLTK